MSVGSPWRFRLLTTLPADRGSFDVRAAAVGLLLLALYVATLALPLSATAHGARFAIPLIPPGLALGAAWRWGGRRVLPFVGLGTVAALLATGLPVVPSVALGAAVVVGAIAAMRVLRGAGFDGSLDRPSGVLAFVLGIAGGAACIAASGAIAWLATAGGSLRDAVGDAGHAWLSIVVSTLVVFPLVVGASGDALRPRAATVPQRALWLLGVAAAVVLIFALPPQYIGIPVFGALLVLVAWAAVRLNLAWALIGALSGTLAVAISGAFRIGILADDAPLRAERLGWNAAILYGLCALGLNAFVASREAAERRYRTLFEESPEPVWLTDPATDRFLEVNAAAVATYGWTAAEFAALRVSDVVLRTPRADIESDGRGHEMHRCRDGRLLNVYARRRGLRLDDRDAQLWFNVDVTERTRLRTLLHRASSEERLRVSRELHDGLGQELTGISFVLGGVSAQMRRGEAPERGEIDRIAELVRSALRSCRMIARGLAPLPDEMPLDEALHVLVERLAGGEGAVVELDVRPGAERLALPVHVKDGMFRICQEAVANALRHSGATVVTVVLDASELGVSMAVWDDGNGFDRHRANAGMGLRTLRLRAEEIGAVLTIDSRPGAGACIECRYLRHAREA